MVRYHTCSQHSQKTQSQSLSSLSALSCSSSPAPVQMPSQTPSLTVIYSPAPHHFTSTLSRLNSLSRILCPSPSPSNLHALLLPSYHIIPCHTIALHAISFHAAIPSYLCPSCASLPPCLLASLPLCLLASLPLCLASWRRFLFCLFGAIFRASDAALSD